MARTAPVKPVAGREETGGSGWGGPFRVYGDDRWLCAGVAALLTGEGAGVVVLPTRALTGATPAAACTRGTVICQLPPALGPLLATLPGLRAVLPSGTEATKVVLITDAPARWVQLTLVNLPGGALSAGQVSVLPTRSRTGDLLHILRGGALPSGMYRRSAGLRSLTADEVAGLAAALMPGPPGGRGTAGQADPLMRSAMRKLGISSRRLLLFWRAGRAGQPTAGREGVTRRARRAP